MVRSLVAGDSSFDLSKTGAAQTLRSVRDEAVDEAEELRDDARSAGRAAAGRTRSTARKATTSARRTARGAERSAGRTARAAAPSSSSSSSVLERLGADQGLRRAQRRRDQRAPLGPQPRRAAQGRDLRAQPREALHGPRAHRLAQEQRVATPAAGQARASTPSSDPSPRVKKSHTSTTLPSGSST